MYKALPPGKAMITFRRMLLLGIIVALAAVTQPLQTFAFDKSVQVRSDLDGDDQSDTAISKICGSTLKIRIRLSGRRTPVLLSASIPNEPGLTLVAYDVNNDSKAELVLTSIFSVHPVAVWLTSPDGRFKRATGWFTAFPVHEE